MLRLPRWIAAALATAFAMTSAPASAQTIDQEQTICFTGTVVDAFSANWQTFRPSVTGRLTTVELVIAALCDGGGCFQAGDLTIAVVTTSGGLPTETVLGSGTVPDFTGTMPFAFVSAEMPGGGIHLTAEELYALRVSYPGVSAPGQFDIAWCLGYDDDYYPRGTFLGDSNPGDGLDDPIPLPMTSDAAFRTWMVPIACGDGVEDPGEECDDGNTAVGDGCSSTCQDEFCGDGVENDAEQCDDGNTVDHDGCSATCLEELCGDGLVSAPGETCDDGATVAGDGCTATCTLEKGALACQSAVLRGAQGYAAARLAALAKCRTAFAAGKPLSIPDGRQCASETATARSLAKAAQRARKTIAGGNKPKCTDALVAMLGACAETVDGLVNASADAGCLLDGAAEGIDRVLSAPLGD